MRSPALLATRIQASSRRAEVTVRRARRAVRASLELSARRRARPGRVITGEVQGIAVSGVIDGQPVHAVVGATGEYLDATLAARIDLLTVDRPWAGDDVPALVEAALAEGLALAPALRSDFGRLMTVVGALDRVTGIEIWRVEGPEPSR